MVARLISMSFWGPVNEVFFFFRKSLPKLNLRPLATTCQSVWPRLKSWLEIEKVKIAKHLKEMILTNDFFFGLCVKCFSDLSVDTGFN